MLNSPARAPAPARGRRAVGVRRQADDQEEDERQAERPARTVQSIAADVLVGRHAADQAGTSTVVSDSGDILSPK